MNWNQIFVFFSPDFHFIAGRDVLDYWLSNVRLVELDHMTPHHDTTSWHTSWHHIMTPHHDTHHDTTSWHHIVTPHHDTTSYHNTTSWHHIMTHIMTPHHDTTSWHHIMTPHHDTTSWHHIVTPHHDTTSWHHIMTPCTSMHGTSRQSTDHIILYQTCFSAGHRFD